jgi:glycosyltransferase involved in cell wall biosynthesis
VKILFTTVDPVEIGRGHYTHIKELVEGLEKRGVQVTMLFGFDGRPDIRCTGGFIDTGARLTRKRAIKDFVNQYTAGLSIKRHIRRNKGQYSLLYGRDWILGVLDGGFQIPTVSEFNGIPSQLREYRGSGLLDRIYIRLLTRRENRALISSSRVICVSEGILRNLKNRVSKKYHSKMRVIDNGVNLNSYVFDESKFLGNRIRIAFVGSFTHWHGVESIAPTMLPILEKYEKVDLLLIGSGPYSEGVKSDLRLYEHSGRVEFTGRIPMEEAAERLSKCHIGFSPHKAGVLGSPLKIREYCGAGLAQVTSRIEGAEFLEAHGLGLLVEPGRIEDYQAALERLLSSKDLIAEMGTRARRYAEKFLSWDNAVDRVLSVCREVSNDSRRESIVEMDIQRQVKPT